jgi:DNA mismatch endonuclease (patch repair protein)
MDTRTSDQRRSIMQAVGQRDTRPEMVVRRHLHSRGYRYRLHVRALPGTPDIVFPSRKKVVFVNGCFWHGHDCPKGRPPKSRQSYWLPKIAANKTRDINKIEALREAGWEVMVVWQCELAKLSRIDDIALFLEQPPRVLRLESTLESRK